MLWWASFRSISSCVSTTPSCPSLLVDIATPITVSKLVSTVSRYIFGNPGSDRSCENLPNRPALHNCNRNAANIASGDAEVRSLPFKGGGRLIQIATVVGRSHKGLQRK